MQILNTIKFITGHPLNKNNKVGALLKFIKWQVGSRLIGESVVYKFVNGTKLIVKNGQWGATGNIYTGLQDFEEMGFLLHFLRKEDVFVDVGANVGVYTVLAAGAIGARVIAAEPIPATFEKLNDNIQINQIDKNVTSLNIGVGDVEGLLSFSEELDTENYVLPEKIKHKGVSVNVRTLDSICSDNVSLIKIDVEGFELNVIKGAEKTLTDQKNIVVIMEVIEKNMEKYNCNLNELYLLMRSFGFQSFEYDPFQRKLIEKNINNKKSKNLIFIKNVTYVEQRLRSAPKFFINNYGIKI